MMNKVYSYPLKVLPSIKSLDKFDDSEIDDFDKYLDEGEFDQFFGILISNKSVSIENMNNVIKQRGGQLS